MSRNFKKNHRKTYRNNSGLLSFLSPVTNELTKRFEKAEIAALGILLFVFFLFPLAIFLAGVAAFFGFRYWKKNNR